MTGDFNLNMEVTKHSDLLENILTAMQTIARSEVDKVSFDRTIKCQIVSAKDKEFGEYTVTDGSSVFRAYSSASYNEGNWVQVTIPEGDFNNQKMIIGKYVADEARYFTYVPPFDTFVDITNNIITEAEQEVGLIANGSIQSKAIQAIEFSNSESFQNFDRLGIKADFRTWLSSFNLVKGTYSLKVHLKIDNREDLSLPIESAITWEECELSNQDMYGDTYNFNDYFSQEKVFDISHITGRIIGIFISFHQNNDFINMEEKNGLEIYGNPASFSENDLLDNIFVQNIYVSFGYDLNKFTEDTILLYSLDGLHYSATLSQTKLENLLNQENITYTMDDYNLNPEQVTAQLLPEANKKRVQFRWIHKDEEENRFIVIDENNIPAGAKIHWYKHSLTEAGIANYLVESVWIEQMIEDAACHNSFEYMTSANNKFFYPDYTKQKELLRVVIESPSRDYLGEQEIQNGDALLYNQWQLVSRWANIISNTIAAKNPLKQDSLFKTLTEEWPKWSNGGGLKLLSSFSSFDDDFWNELNKIELPKNEEKSLLDYCLENCLDGIDLKEDLEKTFHNLIFDYVIKAMRSKINEYLASTKIYNSEFLTFENDDMVADMATIDLISALQIECDTDNLKGVYNIYSNDGRISNNNESIKTRLLTAKYQSKITGREDLDKNLEQITWYIPEENSMITLPAEGTEFFAEKDNVVHGFKKDGVLYTKITRVGVANETPIPGTEVANEVQQCFRIDPDFLPTKCNNTIYCEVYKNNRTYSASYELHFGTKGTNGTDYTFTLELENHLPALTLNPNSYENAKWVRVIPHVYDYKDEEITDQFAASDFEYKWYSTYGNITKAGVFIEDRTAPHDYCCKIVATRQKDYSNISKSEAMLYCQYYILQCKLKNVKIVQSEETTDEEGNVIPAKSIGVNLTTFLPIAVRDGDTWDQYEGVTTITYNTSGVSPVYYREACKLYRWNTQKTQHEELPEGAVLWRMSFGKDTQDKSGKTDTRYYPRVSEKEGIITPVSMYLQNNGKQIAVNAFYNASENEGLRWTQPVLILQDGWGSTLLNSWDGNLTIDEENGTILSAMIGAGKKDDENRFNGVLMGDVKGKSDMTTGIGIYGYNEGAQSFGFNINGTAFLGKKGRGQILFDGNTGEITSANFKENGTGLMLDVDDGVLISQSTIQVPVLNKDGTQKDNQRQTQTAMVVIDPGKTKEDAYFRIQSSNNVNLMYVGDRGYYLQSDTYSQNNGLKINLQNGQIQAKHSENIGGKNKTAEIKIDPANNSSYFKITSVNGNILMNAGTDGYYLRNDDYNEEAKVGMKIDLAKGTLSAKRGLAEVKIDPASDNSYFKITSVNGKPLMNAGVDGYYLRNDAYNDETKSGMEIDLVNGRLTAKYEAAEVKIDPTNTNGYFRVTSINDKELIHIGSRGYFLQNDGYSENDGIKLDLANGILIAKKDLAEVQINPSSNSYFRVISRTGKILFNAGEYYYLQSNDYPEKTDENGISYPSGTHIDLSDGRITSYNLRLTVHQWDAPKNNINNEDLDVSGVSSNITDEDDTPMETSGTGILTINSRDAYTPLQIGTHFKAYWDGQIETSYIKATGGRIGSWYLDKRGLYSFDPANIGDISGLVFSKNGIVTTEEGYEENILISLGQFKREKDENDVPFVKLYAAEINPEGSENISSATTDDDTELNDTSNDANVISYKYHNCFYVTKAGKMFASNAKLLGASMDDVIINHSLIVKGPIKTDGLLVKYNATTYYQAKWKSLSFTAFSSGGTFPTLSATHNSVEVKVSGMVGGVYGTMAGSISPSEIKNALTLTGGTAASGVTKKIRYLGR